MPTEFIKLLLSTLPVEYILIILSITIGGRFIFKMLMVYIFNKDPSIKSVKLGRYQSIERVSEPLSNPPSIENKKETFIDQKNI